MRSCVGEAALESLDGVLAVIRHGSPELVDDVLRMCSKDTLLDDRLVREVAFVGGRHFVLLRHVTLYANNAQKKDEVI